MYEYVYILYDGDNNVVEVYKSEESIEQAIDNHDILEERGYHWMVYRLYD